MLKQIEPSIMARAAPKKITKTSQKTTEAPAQKRLPGRPAGSKNRVSAAGKMAGRVPALPKKSPALPKKAVAAPKMSKMELEAHVVKLERTIARLREQAKGFKLAAAERPKIVEPVKKAAKAPVPSSKPARNSKPAVAAPVKTPRRSAKSPVLDGSTVIV